MNQIFQPGDLVTFTDELYDDNIAPNWKEAVEKARGKPIEVIGCIGDGDIITLALSNGSASKCIASARHLKPYQETVDTDKFLDILTGGDSDVV